MLIENGANVNARDEGANGSTPLIYASCNGHREIAELLIEKGADVNARDEGANRSTALTHASINGYTDSV